MSPAVAPVPPARTQAQRDAALERANEVRTYRAAAKREIKAGRMSLADVLADPMFATAKLSDVLPNLPRWGSARSGDALKRCRIAHAKTCGKLTDRQRGEVLAHVDRHSRPWRRLVPEWGPGIDVSQGMHQGVTQGEPYRTRGSLWIDVKWENGSTEGEPCRGLVRASVPVPA